MRKWWNAKLGGDGRRITRGSVCSALLFIAGGFGVAAALLVTVTKALSFRVDSSWEAYTGLLILAFAIERVVQPFSDALGPVPEDGTERKEAKANTAVVTWGFATALGVIASAAGKAGIMTTVAASGIVPSRWLDVVVTGLVLGAGTKPIHDMLSQVQATKEKKEAEVPDKEKEAKEAKVAAVRKVTVERKAREMQENGEAREEVKYVVFPVLWE